MDETVRFTEGERDRERESERQNDRGFESDRERDRETEREACVFTALASRTHWMCFDDVNDHYCYHHPH